MFSVRLANQTVVEAFHQNWNAMITSSPQPFVESQSGARSITPASLTPAVWGEMLGGKPILDCAIGGAVPAQVRRWQGIAPDIDQRALDQHYLSVHLGGAKRLHRTGEGQRLVRESAADAHSFIPAGGAFLWRTEGPIDFMHVYLAPATVDRFIGTTFDRDPRNVELQDCLGVSDPLIGSLATALIDELSSDDAPQQAFLDDVVHLLLFHVLRRHSSAPSIGARNLYALPPYKLRRALDFIESQLGQAIGVTEIAAACGTSAFHFSRAFRHAMGLPPYAFLLERRMAKARDLLLASMLPLTQVAAECGFGGLSQFSRMFKQATGVSPSGFRNRY